MDCQWEISFPYTISVVKKGHTILIGLAMGICRLTSLLACGGQEESPCVCLPMFIALPVDVSKKTCYESECIAGCSFGESTICTDIPYIARFSFFVRPNAPWLTLPSWFPPLSLSKVVSTSRSRRQLQVHRRHAGNLSWCQNVTRSCNQSLCPLFVLRRYLLM